MGISNKGLHSLPNRHTYAHQLPHVIAKRALTRGIAGQRGDLEVARRRVVVQSQSGVRREPDSADDDVDDTARRLRDFPLTEPI